jgi:hypothetical protein
MLKAFYNYYIYRYIYSLLVFCLLRLCKKKRVDFSQLKNKKKRKKKQTCCVLQYNLTIKRNSEK